MDSCIHMVSSGTISTNVFCSGNENWCRWDCRIPVIPFGIPYQCCWFCFLCFGIVFNSLEPNFCCLILDGIHMIRGGQKRIHEMESQNITISRLLFKTIFFHEIFILPLRSFIPRFSRAKRNGIIQRESSRKMEIMVSCWYFVSIFVTCFLLSSLRFNTWKVFYFSWKFPRFHNNSL